MVGWIRLGKIGKPTATPVESPAVDKYAADAGPMPIEKLGCTVGYNIRPPTPKGGTDTG